MSIQLVAIDVDDTLLTSTHQVLTSTITAVKAAIAQGVKVVLCSGRPLAGVAPYLAQLGIKGADQYVITYNGAITATTSGQVMAQYLIDNAQYRRLTTFATHHQASFNVLDAHSTIYTADHDVNRITVVQAWENNAGLLVRQPDELPTDFQITKGVFGGEKAALDELEPIVRQTFSDELAVIRAGANFLEVLNPVVSKGQALKALMAHLALAPAAVMAIGDEANDLSMFDVAGTAVAMANGSWLAREHADIVTKSNDDGGIAAAFAQVIFNEAVDKLQK
ncbi:Cof-type HAD-IIB family hydrolase [Lactiplantibacillus daowaiensis]|uniref:Cof-type HAD-IIB family hydrolase n=1 Tax=Lactiplantibacillus daowaiensis TaxID=2559918 RepID=A0ABW1S4U3_9LACO|nr:Cof-type HAD-IIB family hydrolase [Lactiplantibacillus daowaiensis]